MFKLLLFDIGLLGCMLDLPVNLIYSQDYGTAKGYFAENFVAQEFTASGVSKLYSWTQGASEIEFLRVINEALVPVEVKSGTRTQAKSLRQYILKYSPKRAVKISAKPLYRTKGSVLQNYPLYLAAKL
jgi:predicted AAA+ superfamily ATPase